MTKQMLEETSDTFGMLDSHNRELELLLSNGSTATSKQPTVSRGAQKVFTHLASSVCTLPAARMPAVAHLGQPNGSDFQPLSS